MIKTDRLKTNYEYLKKRCIDSNAMFSYIQLICYNGWVSGRLFWWSRCQIRELLRLWRGCCFLAIVTVTCIVNDHGDDQGVFRSLTKLVSLSYGDCSGVSFEALLVIFHLADQKHYEKKVVVKVWFWNVDAKTQWQDNDKENKNKWACWKWFCYGHRSRHLRGRWRGEKREVRNGWKVCRQWR